MEIDPNTWSELRNSVLFENLVSQKTIEDHYWKAVIFDDNAFDFDLLEDALRRLDIAKYYCVPTSDLYLPPAEARVLKIAVSSKGWRQFFEF